MDYSNIHRLNAPSQQPRPLLQDIDGGSEYPLSALGDLLGNAAKVIAENVQCPKSIAGQSILAAASLAVQGFRNVYIDGRDYPASLFCLTVAESGDRKSAADRLALRAHKEFQKKAVSRFRREKEMHSNAKLAYETEQTRIKNDKSLDSEERLEKLNSICAPPDLLNPQIIVEEPTLEGLFKSYEFGQPSQGLFNDEGGQFLGGHAMSSDNRQKTITGLSKMWDGAEITRTRATGNESNTMYNKRLSIHLMIQPIIADNIFGDTLLNGQGFLPRFLISYSKSIAGTRGYKELDCSQDPHLAKFWSAMNSILEKPAPVLQEDENIPLLPLSDQAKTYWIEIYNRIEVKLAKGRQYEAIKPTASKAAENILRIAAVLSLVEDIECKEIQLRHVKNASQLMDYYLGEAKRLTEGPGNKLLLERAQALLLWLQEDATFPEGIVCRELTRRAPRSLKIRKAECAQKLIDVLVKYGWLIALPSGTEVNSRVPKIAYKLFNEPG